MNISPNDAKHEALPPMGNCISYTEALEIAVQAVRLYAETHPRPSQVTQTQAAEMLGISRPTASKYVRAGLLRLNTCGMVPIGEVDRMLEAR